MQQQKHWQVYLSGEIHSDWREQIQAGVEKAGLAVTLTGPVTDHAASDDVGQVILGDEPNAFWKDKCSAQINAIRTKTLLAEADVAVIRFGEKYKQWNAAFDAGFAAANGTPFITLHDEAIIHPLKEVNAAAMASCRNAAQVVEILTYVIAAQ